MQQKNLPYAPKCENRFDAKVTELLALPKTLGHLNESQGGCLVGDVQYQAFVYRHRPSGQELNEVKLAKIDVKTGEILKLSRTLFLHHANDMTYNSKTGKLLVSNNAPHRKWLTVIDPDTLEMERTIELPVDIFGISYNEKKDIYAVGISFGKSFCLLDADFRVIDDKIYSPSPLTERYVNQGIGSDDDFIYFAFWDAYTLHDDPENFQSTVAAYRWNGEFAGLIDFNIGAQEPENLSTRDGKIVLIADDDGFTHFYELS